MSCEGAWRHDVSSNGVDGRGEQNGKGRSVDQLDDDHDALACRPRRSAALVAGFDAGCVAGAAALRSSRQRARFCVADAVREDPAVADPHEALRQHVEEEATDELGGFERHELPCVSVGVVLPPERDVAVFQRDEAAVRDRDAMRVPREVLEDVLGPAERAASSRRPTARDSSR